MDSTLLLSRIECLSVPKAGGSGMSIIIVMEDQIIAEQIDVIVVGDRKYEFMALMLEREFEFD